MYKVQRRSSLLLFLIILAVGIGLSIVVPSVFHDTNGEIPAFALFPGEIAIALILSVLLFENASPVELIKIACVMLFVSFIDGAICNFVGKSTMWMPDYTLQLNWVQLIAFNLTGMGAIMSLYTTVAEQSSYGSASASAVRESQAKEPAASTPPKIDFSPQEAATSNQDAQELLNQIDHSRIEKLEQSISTAAPEHVSLESLFAEETEAAGGGTPAGGKKQESMWVSKEEHKQEQKAEQAREDAREEAREAAKEAIAKETAAKEEAPEPIKAVELVVIKEEVQVQKEEPVAQAEPVKPVAETPAAAPTGGLLGDVSNDIEDLFGSLVGEEAQKDFTPAEKAAKEAEAAKAAEAAKVEEATPPPPAAAEPVAADAAQSFGPKMTEAGTSAKAAVKEFGKLSATAGGKQEQATGTLKTIGQMLLDTAAVEKIIKKGESPQDKGSKWRILTVDRGANLQALMDKVAAYPGVESALLMGKDGLLLSNTESVAAMKYVYGPLSLAMHSTTNLGTSKLQLGELRQAVLKTGDKINILTDVGSAILAVFGTWDTATLDGLMDHINVAVAGSDAIDGELPTEVPDLSAEPEPTPPPPAEPEPVKKEEPAGGVVNVSDNEMSDLFDNLLAEDSSDKKAEESAKSAPAPAAPAPAPAGGVLNVSDNEMSDLFDNLLADDSADKKKEEAAAAKVVEDARVAEEAKTAAATAAAGGLLNVSDKEVGDLFDNLLGGGDAAPAAEKKSMDFSPAEKPAEPAPAAAVEPVAAEAKEAPKKEEKPRKKPEQIKEFGKLSIQASAKDTGTEAGAMKAIGRQLIDVQAVENIIKAGEKREKIGSGLTTARVISAARGEGIKQLLHKIDTFEGVIGSLIVGHDGLVIASTLSGGIDKDMMGAMCTAIHGHLDGAVKKMDKGKLHQSVFVGSNEKLTVMTGVAVGILAVFVDNAGVEKIDGLLAAIENTVRG